jgi:hypothetical protein
MLPTRNVPFQRLFHVRVGRTVTGMFRADRQVEADASPAAR